MKRSEGCKCPSDHCGRPPERVWLRSVTVWLKPRKGVAKSPDTCGYGSGIHMSDEIKEELMELIVVGDLPISEDNITDYFIKLREGTQQETP